MTRNDLLKHFALLAKDKVIEAAHEHGKPLAKKVLRPAGEKIMEHASKRAMDKGLIKDPVNLDQMIETLKAQYNAGLISKENFQKLKDAVIREFGPKNK